MDRLSHNRKEPAALGDVLSHLFALRGYGRIQGDRQLHDAWREVAGEAIARQTRASGVKNGALQVGVAGSALLSELAAFHKASLLQRLRELHPQLKINDIRFQLRGDLAKPADEAPFPQ